MENEYREEGFSIDDTESELDTGVLLLCDNEYGEGYVIIEDYFKAKSALFQMDCLKDWIVSLETTYNELFPVWEAELNEAVSSRKKN